MDPIPYWFMPCRGKQSPTCSESNFVYKLRTASCYKESKLNGAIIEVAKNLKEIKMRFNKICGP